MDSELTIVTRRPRVAPHLWCWSDQPSGQPGDRQTSVWLGTRCSSLMYTCTRVLQYRISVFRRGITHNLQPVLGYR